MIAQLPPTPVDKSVYNSKLDSKQH